MEASYESVAGLIRTRWERNGKEILLEVEVPVNTTATLRLEGKEKSLGAGRHTITWTDSSAPD